VARKSVGEDEAVGGGELLEVPWWTAEGVKKARPL